MIAAILAGGRSRRMGSDTALVDFGGKPLAARPMAADPAMVHSLNAPGELKEGLTLFNFGGDR